VLNDSRDLPHFTAGLSLELRRVGSADEKKMNLAIQSDQYLKNGIEGGLERIGGIGYKYATYTVKGRYDEPFVDFSDDELKKEYGPIGKAFEEKGIKIVYNELSTEMYVNYLTNTNAAREKMVIQTIKASSFMGVSHLLLKPFFIIPAGDDPVSVTREKLYELLELFMPVAKEYGVKLLITNNTFHNTKLFFGSEPEDLLELYERYGVMTVIDPVNAYKAKWKLSKAMMMIKDVIYAYQITDVEPSVRNPFMPMMGSIDYPQVIRTLAAISEERPDFVAVMNANIVFKRFSEFDSDGLDSALDNLLYKMGRIIVGDR